MLHTLVAFMFISSKVVGNCVYSSSSHLHVFILHKKAVTERQTEGEPANSTQKEPGPAHPRFEQWVFLLLGDIALFNTLQSHYHISIK